jgi:DNA-directed RNA polymerase specialized sigma24 family protein
MNASLAAPCVFATTRWSIILHAGKGPSAEADLALAELCRVYWYPLYAYVRRLGHDMHSAQDLTQDFFYKLLEKNYVGQADRRRGKFRWFLLTAFKCFLANEWDRIRAQKRGGGQEAIALDGLTAEQRYALEPVDKLSADQIYERRWALDLLESVRTQLREEYFEAGKPERFDLLAEFLPGEKTGVSYAEIAPRLGLTENAVKQEVYRMKRRYGELLRAEISSTVAHADEVNEEIRYLIDVVCRR